MAKRHSTTAEQQKNVFNYLRAEYKTWARIKNRCHNPNSKTYDAYGARGIRVCPGWRHSFPDFFKDMGPKPGPEYSIDRLDNNHGYSCGHCEWCVENDQPANCRWATPEQQKNNRGTSTPFWALWIERTKQQKEKKKKAGPCVLMDPAFRELLKRARKPPVVRKHSTGQAAMVIAGRSFYLGQHGSPIALQRHAQVVELWHQVRNAKVGIILPKVENCPRPILPILPP